MSIFQESIKRTFGAIHYRIFYLQNTIATPIMHRTLDDKKTLTVQVMDTLLSRIPMEEKSEYDRGVIEDIYIAHMAQEAIDSSALVELAGRFAEKTVVVIAPGKSSEDQKEKIWQFVRDNDCITVSVNFEYGQNEVDYVFVSNIKRYNTLGAVGPDKLIVTSNITSPGSLTVDYRSLLNKGETIQDNAGMMLLTLLKQLGAGKVMLAGLDGYSYNVEDNYSESGRMLLTSNKKYITNMNSEMADLLNEYKKEMDIEFLTTPKFISLQ